MAYEEKRAAAPVKPHQVTVSEREKLTVTGVEEVLRFDENEVELRTSRGRLLVRGEDLHVGKLAIESGELGVDGTVAELVYADEPEPGGFFRRLFG